MARVVVVSLRVRRVPDVTDSHIYFLLLFLWVCNYHTFTSYLCYVPFVNNRFCQINASKTPSPTPLLRTDGGGGKGDSRQRARSVTLGQSSRPQARDMITMHTPP